jgi:uncharacterized protein (UPF0248 family)
MTNPRDILNNIKWNSKYNFDFVEIFYIHRGAPNDTKIISGKEIIALEKSFLQTIYASIPYHRIFKILYKNEVIFSR